MIYEPMNYFPEIATLISCMLRGKFWTVKILGEVSSGRMSDIRKIRRL